MELGASPSIANLNINNKGGESNDCLEIVSGSDEYDNTFPELGLASALGIWRALDTKGNLEWAADIGNDEAGSVIWS